MFIIIIIFIFIFIIIIIIINIINIFIDSIKSFKFIITDEDIKSDTFKAVVEVLINDILREAIDELKQTGNNGSTEPGT